MSEGEGVAEIAGIESAAELTSVELPDVELPDVELPSIELIMEFAITSGDGVWDDPWLGALKNKLTMLTKAGDCGVASVIGTGANMDASRLG